MKKIPYKEEQFLKTLEQEREYRCKSSGDNGNEPFLTPLLFSIKHSLHVIISLLGFLVGYVLLQLLGLAG